MQATTIGIDLAKQVFQVQRPSRFAIGYATARQQNGMGSHKLVCRRAHVCSGVMKHEVFELHEFARAPQGGAGVVEMRAESERLGDGTGAKPLVETREGVRGDLSGRLQALE